MSIRSDRKWAEKQSREDMKLSPEAQAVRDRNAKGQALREKNAGAGPRPTAGSRGQKEGPVKGQGGSGNAPATFNKPEPKVSLKEQVAKQEKAKSALSGAARVASNSARAMTNMASKGTGPVSKVEHKAAGEAHMRAAEANKAAGNHAAEAGHKEAASSHAEQAGGEWDEDKHPRDENGKFS